MLAVPTLNLPTDQKKRVSVGREERLLRRQQTKVKMPSLSVNEANTSCDQILEETEIRSQEDIESLLSSINNQSNSAYQKSFRDVEIQVNVPFQPTVSNLILTESALKSFTGLQSFDVLNCIVYNVEKVYKDTRSHKLSIKDRVILVFTMMKCNLTFAILSILFGISPVVCRTYFCDMVVVISRILRSVIKMPKKEEVLANMPICFSAFKDTEIVVDCTEVFIQRPKCLCCRIKFYSHYKSGETVKFMTGVSPGGLITFVSNAYGGRASAKAIFDQSGLISRLSEGSAIMADKGFLIDNICAEKKIKLYRPPFLRNKKQLTAEEAIFNTNIAAARIHIERCNQRIKIFKILCAKFPFSLIHLIEDVFVIACAITNLSSPILSDDKFL